MLRKAICSLISFLFAFIASFTFWPQHVNAHESIPAYRWYSPTSRHQNINSSWGWAVTEAASAYNATDLTSTAVSGQTGDGLTIIKS